ncbi:MAG: hypothetical protein M3Y24_02565 [Acidobacteriota bacterium]|nr:hypothetical protein [Acidobacteriota bacterium]
MSAVQLQPYNRCTPILVDLTGKGFKLTDTQDGVWFDILANGTLTKIPWPAEGEANAWLVLDRNHNGIIDDATELFGNVTPQPKTSNPNGYLALAEFDKPANGGNGDGVIDLRDKIFNSLRLWIDKNHDGVSQPDELFPLAEFGIHALDLKYTTWPFTDPNGNEFRYRGYVEDAKGSHVVWVISQLPVTWHRQPFGNVTRL